MPAHAAFADRLISAIREKRTPAMVGIDPQWNLIPEALRTEAVKTYGETLEAIASAYRRFCSTVIDQVSDLVPVVKFQSAFFEAAGHAGMKVLHGLIDQAKDAGLIVIYDGKRGDIGSTAAAYAQAFIGKAPVERANIPVWSADALTVNPFLGAEGIDPFLKTAKEEGTGIFVLVRTSNPGAGKLQDLVAGDRTIYQTIADWVEDWSNDGRGDSHYGPAGAVVGATVPDQVVELRKRMPHVILLIPGYGAQGGTSADTAAAFDKDGLGAVVNSSRGILYAYKDAKYSALKWQDAIAAATKAMIDDLAANTPAGKLR